MTFALLPRPARADEPQAEAGGQAGRLTLYFHPSPYGIHWDSPRGLAWSTVWNQILPDDYGLPHRIGHANVRLACRRSNGAMVYWLTGMTDVDSSAESKFILDGKGGLQVLFERFAGRLQEESEVSSDLDERMANGDVVWVGFMINEAQCDRLSDYFDGYRAAGADKSYGLSLRPRYREGSGCTAFAVSFADVGGFLTPEMRNEWSKSIDVPLKLMRQTPDEPGVSIWTLLFSSDADHWAGGYEPSRRLVFWDPDAMAAWVKKRWDQESDSGDGEFALESNQQSVGLVTDVSGWPVPTGPIFLGP